jgi:hypothetical protein
MLNISGTRQGDKIGLLICAQSGDAQSATTRMAKTRIRVIRTLPDWLRLTD